jgi:hypothetical protein
LIIFLNYLKFKGYVNKFFSINYYLIRKILNV